MKIKILGCSGGIGGKNARTTSMLVDDDILIDAGTGVGDLSIEDLTKIDHVFVTHAHLDHIACLPLIPDTVGEKRSQPLMVYATSETQSVIKQHIFNWAIWPDFSEIPSKEKPFMKFCTVEVGKSVEIAGRKITALPARHTVPAVGYHLDGGTASLVFTGDTTTHDELWQSVNRIDNLRYLIIETAFSNKERPLAILSKHLCPSLLAEELNKLSRVPEVFITHLKPGQASVIMREIAEAAGRHKPGMLQNGQIFEL